MSWLEEAQQKIKQKQEQPTTLFSLDTEEQRDHLVKRLKALYDNATEREINKAIDEALERFSPPYDEKAFMAFLRTNLED